MKPQLSQKTWWNSTQTIIIEEDCLDRLEALLFHIHVRWRVESGYCRYSLSIIANLTRLEAWRSQHKLPLLQRRSSGWWALDHMLYNTTCDWTALQSNKTEWTVEKSTWAWGSLGIKDSHWLPVINLIPLALVWTSQSKTLYSHKWLTLWLLPTKLSFSPADTDWQFTNWESLYTLWSVSSLCQCCISVLVIKRPIDSEVTISRVSKIWSYTKITSLTNDPL